MAMKYVERMAAEILENGDVSDVGIDQGIHNHLIYTEHFGPTEIMGMENGLVMTLQEAAEFRVDAFGRVLNGRGEVQYFQFEGRTTFCFHR